MKVRKNSGNLGYFNVNTQNRNLNSDLVPHYMYICKPTKVH